MGSKSSNTPVADYFMTIHYGVCYGVLDQVNQIYIKELPVWCGKMTEPGTIEVNLPELFGGDTSEGGVRGTIDVYFGTDSQVMSVDAAAQYDLTPETMPGYRQLANVMFRGPNSEAGFKWQTNNPYLPAAWINGTRIPKQLSEEFAVIYPNGKDYTESIEDTPEINVENLRNPITLGAAAEDIDAGLVFFTYSITGTFLDNSDDSPLSGAVILDMRFYTSPDGTGSAMPGTAIDLGGFTDDSGSRTETASGALPPGCRSYTVEMTITPTFPVFGYEITEASGTFTYPTYGPAWCEVDGSLASLPQANPAHMIYEALTDSDLGMGGTAESIDTDSFMYAAEVFHGENFGLTAFWADQSEVESYINEIINHVQAALFLSPTTGLWTLVPYRADYDIETVPVLDESNCTLENNQRKGLGETVNEVVISWTNPDTEELETITFQDPGNVAAQGALVSTTRTYYMIRHEELANHVGARDIRAASYPLYATDAYVDRSMRGLFPGAVIKLNWSADGISGMAMRVGEVDYGQPGDSKIKLSLTEDIFGLELTTYTSIQRSLWVDETLIAPTPMTYVDFMTAPLALFLRAGNSLTDLSDDLYPAVPVVVLAKRDGGGTVSTFDLTTDGFLPNGDPAAIVRAKLTPTPTGLTTAILVQEDSTIMAGAEVRLFLGINEAAPGTFLKVGLGDTTSELVMLDAYDTAEDTWTVARGMYDTVPQYWPVGTRCWYLGDFLIPVDPSEQNSGVEITYNLLPTSSGGTLALADSTPYEFTPSDRPYAPIRPANIEIVPDGGTAAHPYPTELQNAGAEVADLSGWDAVSGVVSITSIAYAVPLLPVEGARLFNCGSVATANMEQRLSVPLGLLPEVDAGSFTMLLTWFQAGFDAISDPSRIEVDFEDESLAVISTFVGSDIFSGAQAWLAREQEVTVPALTRSVIVRFAMTRTSGSNLNCAIDDIRLRWGLGGLVPLVYIETAIPTTLELSWANRNRLSEDVIAPRWTDANVTPEVDQTTSIRVRERYSDVMELEETGLTGTTYSLDLSSLTEYRFYDIEFVAVRDGFESIQFFTQPLELVRTGYGNNYSFDYGENDG